MNTQPGLDALSHRMLHQSGITIDQQALYLIAAQLQRMIDQQEYVLYLLKDIATFTGEPQGYTTTYDILTDTP